MPEQIIVKINGACLIFDNKRRFLLLRRSFSDDSMPGVWELPSGTIEEAESVLEGTLREVKEETGIELKTSDLSLVDTEYYEFINKKNVLKKVTEHTYLVKLIKTPEIHLTDEHCNFCWASVDNIEKFYPNKNDMIYNRINRIMKRG